jgi:hypothetical protein
LLDVSLKSYKGRESRPHYCFLAFIRPTEDDDGEGPSPSQVLRSAFGGRDTDDSTENSSESFYERRPVMAIMSYVTVTGLSARQFAEQTVA